MNNVKIAIIHDWLTGMRGGEKCLEVFCELFPDATLFTLVHDKGSVSKTIENMDIRTSFLQGLPGISKNYRNFLPLFPFAIEGFDLSGYKLILSSSHCVAKGVKIPSKALHICYCYTPMRYAWTFFDEYFSKVNPLKRWFISNVITSLKKWDITSNKRIDYFIAISDNVKNRINEFYNRDADVIYPPVDINSRERGYKSDEFYLVVSALVPYKRIDLAIEAFNENGKKLVIIGSGTEFKRLKRMSAKNIIFLGWVDEGNLREYYARCQALIFPQEEDFGIAAIEAGLHGKPVVAYAKGGVLEVVIPLTLEEESCCEKYPTGVFFDHQTPLSLNKAIDIFEKNRNVFNPDKIRENVLRFNRDRFKREIEQYIQKRWSKHVTGL